MLHSAQNHASTTVAADAEALQRATVAVDLIDHSAAQGRGERVSAERSEAVPSPGLVKSVTSGHEHDYQRLNRRRRLSRMRRKVLSSSIHLRDAPDGHRLEALFVTLTYREVDGYRARHIAEYVKALKRSVSFDVRYVWVLELQRRGAPHYHLVVWIPRGEKIPLPDSSGQWPHGSSQVQRARHPVSYIMKYASKGTDVDKLPRGARICGGGGLGVDGRRVVRWWLLPRYQRVRCTVDDDVHRCTGGGWVSLVTGEWWPPSSAELVALVEPSP